MDDDELTMCTPENVAKLMLFHGAKNNLVQYLTDLSEYRIKQLPKGPNPTRGRIITGVNHFMRSRSIKIESVLFYSIYSRKRTRKRLRSGDIEGALELVDAYDSYLHVAGEKPLLFNEAYSLVEKIGMDEIEIKTCEDCDAPFISRSHSKKQKRCDFCVTEKQYLETDTDDPEKASANC